MLPSKGQSITEHGLPTKHEAMRCVKRQRQVQLMQHETPWIPPNWDVGMLGCKTNDVSADFRSTQKTIGSLNVPGAYVKMVKSKQFMTIYGHEIAGK